MSGSLPPIPPPLGTSSGSTGNPNVNRVDTMPTTSNHINTTTTTNVPQSVVHENLHQLLDSRGGSHLTNVLTFDKEDFTSWKVRFLVFLDGLEPYLLKTLEDGPIVPMSSLTTSKNPLPKRQNQWSNAESRLANQDKGLKSSIISCLSNDVMKSIIKCKTAKDMWNDLILAHEGPYDTRDTKVTALRLKFNAFKSLKGEKDSDSNIEEDQRTSNEFMADLNAEYHERALLANQKRFYKRSGRVRSDRKPIDKSKETYFACGKPEDEGNTKIRALMAIIKDEPSVRKADARSSQWVDITMKHVHRLLSMTDGDERKRVLDYTHVDLHYMKDRRKNLVNKFNLLKQELSLHKWRSLTLERSLKNGPAVKSSLTNCSLSKYLATLSMSIPEVTSDSESKCETREPLPPLPKLTGVAPAGTSDSLISLVDLTLNMADLTLNTSIPKKTNPTFVNVSSAYVIKHCGLRNHIFDDCYSKPKCSTCGSTDHLTKEHLKQTAIYKTLTKLKAQSSMNSSTKKAPMIPRPFKECKYYGFNDHHSDNYEFYPGCEVCGSIAHEPADCPKKYPNNKKPRIANKQSTKPTEKYGKNRMGRMELFLRTRQAGCLRGLNQQEGIDCESKLYTVADWKAIRTLFWLCAYMGFMVVPDGLRVLLEWEISEEVLFNNLLGLNACGIYNHVLCWSAKKQSSVAMSSAEDEYVVMLCLCHIKNNPVLHSRTKQFESGFTSSESSILIRTDVHYLPRILTVNGMGLATLGLFDKDKPTLSSNVLVNAVVTTDKSLYRAQCRPITYSNAPTDLKIKMKKNPPSSKPKSPYKVRVILPKKQVVETQHAEVTVATADATQRLEASESTVGERERSGKVKGTLGLKRMSMPDVDLASTMLYSVSILWSSSRRVVLTHNTVNQIESSITKHVSDSIQSTVPLTVSNTLKEQLPGLLSNALKDTLPQLIKDSIKSSVIKKSIIVKRYGKIAYDVFRGRSPDISYFHVFGCPIHIHNHKDHLGKFDEKADDGFFLGYTLVAKAFWVCNIRRREMEETVHVTISEDNEAISQSSTEGDAINFNEYRSFPNDEFLKPRSKATQCSGNIEYFPYIPAYENITSTYSPIPWDSISPEDPPEFTIADDHSAPNELD
ncbi:hypothetical protein Tco_0952209 [Tanacetum coccineum]|uniref:Retroviral polymerase SH3-like domain-containing protein n=1 Tax=Tanacetum coccineum TaxID=301880 RepID=A0ABQ5E306_9ASTR